MQLGIVASYRHVDGYIGRIANHILRVSDKQSIRNTFATMLPLPGVDNYCSVRNPRISTNVSAIIGSHLSIFYQNA
jgi:hypothetical protein